MLYSNKNISFLFYERKTITVLFLFSLVLNNFAPKLTNNIFSVALIVIIMKLYNAYVAEFQ